MENTLENQINTEMEKEHGWLPDKSQMAAIVKIVRMDNMIDTVEAAVLMWWIGYEVD